jgi:uncharacterized protein YutE (UPF0331/DUF86 family)
MVSSNIIKKKINAIQHNLTRIMNYNHLTPEEFLGNEDAEDIVIHNLFIMLQNVIDIGTHIIADTGLEEPDYLAEIPEVLVKEKVISVELLKPLKAMIGLRNIIAHEYGDLDFKIIYKIVHENMGDIQLFLQGVIQYCGL